MLRPLRESDAQHLTRAPSAVVKKPSEPRKYGLECDHIAKSIAILPAFAHSSRATPKTWGRLGSDLLTL
ncbi:hypothetical protein ABLE93_04525 [Xanthobacter sp. KR7-65]|uniref:hypothetical protein n=1 Tax=Xanthobacter sp. KR7-65 TaxID=3156612 RepID=UPI0032B4C14C